jgi:hypothetical protein
MIVGKALTFQSVFESIKAKLYYEKNHSVAFYIDFGLSVLELRNSPACRRNHSQTGVRNPAYL